VNTLSPAKPEVDRRTDRAPARGGRAAWAVLGAAMATSATWLLLSARNVTFAGDDIYYYAQYIVHGFATEPGGGLEYFLAPHNGHLQAGGKVLYRLLLDLVGTNYTVFRAVEILGYLAAVGLFYALARRRLGSLVALAPGILLLFLGYAWEPMIWAFDMHTTYALVFGLAALLALERGDRRSDICAAGLLVLSLSMIELGLAFVVGVAVSVLMRPDRRQRAWIFVVPLALYAVWWIWARQFDQSSISLLNVHLIPQVLIEALASIAGSVTGLNPTGATVAPQQTTVTSAGVVLAILAILGLAARVRRGPVPRSLWVFLAVAVAYWITIALGGRPPDSSRYIFPGTVLVLLVAADALAGFRLPSWGAIAAFAIVALAIPPNIAKFYDGRRIQLNDAAATRSEYAMLELSRNHVDPGYTPGADPEVVKAGGGVTTSLPAGEYFRASAEFGPLGYSLARLREQPLTFRQVADVTSIDALGLGLRTAGPPARPSACFSILDASPQNAAYLPLPRAGALLGSRSSRPIEVRLSRFAKDGFGRGVGTLKPGSWAVLKASPDRAPERWRILLTGPTYVCPPPH
jgi:hypothetical protein